MTLTEIVKHLEWCHYTCEHGPLEVNLCFLALKEMAEKEEKPLRKQKPEIVTLDLWQEGE